MQKLNSKQTIYMTLPKNDYIEPASEEVVIDEKESPFKVIINTIKNIKVTKLIAPKTMAYVIKSLENM